MEHLSGPALTELKKLFAAGLAQGLEPFIAVCNAVPGHMSLAYSNLANRAELAKLWPEDPEVLAFLSCDSGGLSKEEFQRELWLSMKHAKDPSGKAKLAKVLAETMGWVEAPGKKADAGIVPGVLEVPVYRDDDAWETSAASQQRDLAQASGTERVQH